MIESHAGWICFCISLIVSAILLLCIAGLYKDIDWLAYENDRLRNPPEPESYMFGLYDGCELMDRVRIATDDPDLAFDMFVKELGWGRTLVEGGLTVELMDESEESK